MSFNPKTKLYIDTETTGVRYFHGDRPFMVQLGDQDCNTWHCEWPVDPLTREVTPSRKDLCFLRDLFLDPKLPKDSFNRKFDQRMLAGIGLEIKGRFDDTFLKARICRTNELEYGLNYLADSYHRIGNEDANMLKVATQRARAIGRKKGWKLYDYGDAPYMADYWMIKLVDPDNEYLKTYGLKDLLRLFVMSETYEYVMEEDPARRVAYEKELQLLPIVMKMEERGVAINPVLNEEQRVFYIGEHKRYTEECRNMLVKDRKIWWNEEKRYVYKRTGEKKAVEPFNPGSGPQAARVIYSDDPEGYGLECVRWTKPTENNNGGNPSTDWKALREYSDHPFVRILTLCNGAEKASQFFVQYKEMMVEEQLNSSSIWVLHCEFDQGGTKTLRFSCRKPNMQQAAKGGGVSKARSRGPIKPRPGYRFYMLDYANQEARIFAEISQIQELVDACSDPTKDVNTVLANRIWGGKNNPKALISAARALELGNEYPTNLLAVQARQRLGWQNEWCSLGVTSYMALKFANKFLALYDYDIVKAEKAIDPEGSSFTRTRAKNVLFAKLYGGGATAIMDFMFCSKQEAWEMLQDFEAAWPGIVAAMDAIIEVCEAQGYIETLYKNKLDIDPGLEYKGINYLVQGTAAAMMKDAMLRLDAYLKRTGLDAHIVLTVHDELVFEIKIGHDHPWLLRGIKVIMENNHGRIKSLPMKVECARAVARWDEKEALIVDAKGVRVDKKVKTKVGEWVMPIRKKVLA